MAGASARRRDYEPRFSLFQGVINNGFDSGNALTPSEQIAQQCPHREERTLA